MAENKKLGEIQIKYEEELQLNNQIHAKTQQYIKDIAELKEKKSNELSEIDQKSRELKSQNVQLEEYLVQLQKLNKLKEKQGNNTKKVLTFLEQSI